MGDLKKEGERVKSCELVYLTALTWATLVKLIPCRDWWWQPDPGTAMDQEGLCAVLQKSSAGLHQKEDP